MLTFACHMRMLAGMAIYTFIFIIIIITAHSNIHVKMKLYCKNARLFANYHNNHQPKARLSLQLKHGKTMINVNITNKGSTRYHYASVDTHMVDVVP